MFFFWYYDIGILFVSFECLDILFMTVHALIECALIMVFCCSFGINEFYNGCRNMIITFTIIFLIFRFGEKLLQQALCGTVIIFYLDNVTCACYCCVTYRFSMMYCRFYLRNIATIEGLIRIQITPQTVSFAWLQLISCSVQMIAWYSDGMFYFIISSLLVLDVICYFPCRWHHAIISFIQVVYKGGWI